MEQKFIKFEEAIETLGISSERLNDLRENGLLRAYRDGSSWKFRADEIEKMAQEGVPEISPESDIGLELPDELADAGATDSESKSTDSEESDLELADLDEESDEPAKSTSEEAKQSDKQEKSQSEPEESSLELELGDTDTVSGDNESELELAGSEDEDTVTASTSDLALEDSSESGDASDSILLSEEELGESVGGSASTIIGRKELDSQDADLELASDDDDEVTDEGQDKPSSGGESHVLSSGVSGSGVLDELDESGGTSAFKDLEELEIDLAAESSMALNPEEATKAKKEQEKSEKEKASAKDDKDDGDLKLHDDSEVGEEGNMGSTDIPVGEVEPVAEEGSGSELELSGDDDLILSDSEGSDITLDSGDSGINLVSPSDSGVALDDIPLDAGGSAILSSLSLEGSDPEISLLGSDAESKKGSSAELQTDDDFQLTPLSEGAEEEGDSSSQVIALDADVADLGEEGALDDVGYSEEAGDDVVLSDDFSEAPAEEIGMDSYAAPAGAAATTEQPYTVLNLLGLGSCVVLLLLAGTMMFDMIRNIWSWEEPYAINSAMIESLLGLFGLN